MDKEYYAEHYWWDEEDREYVLCAKWLHERNYPEMPDYWVLLDLEIEEPKGVEMDTRRESFLWDQVNTQGPPAFDAMREVYHI